MIAKNFQYNTENKWDGIEDLKNLDSKNTLVMAFSSPLFRDKPEIIKELKGHFPESSVIGCSTSGEILDEEVSDLSLSISVIQFSSSRFKMICESLSDPSESYDLGKKLATQIKDSDLKGVIVLSDGLVTNGSALAEGINSILGEDIVIAGGLAGDGNKFENTFVIKEDKVLPGSIVAVGLYGDKLSIANASKGGWDIFGIERTITRSQGNVLYEVDGRPALELYKEYLGDKSKDLPASGLLFPLQIRKNKADKNVLVRTVLAVDEKEKSLTFAGDLPTGYLAQFMKANFERVIDAAGEVGEKLFSEVTPENEEGNSYVLTVSCVGRRLVLGARVEEELESLKNSIGSSSAISGFYSYGELGVQVGDGNACDLHNQSMTVMRISELDENAGKKAS